MSSSCGPQCISYKIHQNESLNKRTSVTVVACVNFTWLGQPQSLPSIQKPPCPLLSTRTLCAAQAASPVEELNIDSTRPPRPSPVVPSHLPQPRAEPQPHHIVLSSSHHAVEHVTLASREALNGLGHPPRALSSGHRVNHSQNQNH